MHMADALLAPAVAATMYVASGVAALAVLICFIGGFFRRKNGAKKKKQRNI